ncbi:calcium-binding EGF domain-containing protein [Phthorimaea operculella]|nr:calcium-binding EGF domain-containing protein [Phthorimaea operculella]
MWVVLCILGLMSLGRGADGSVMEEMGKTTELCCRQGTSYARTHNSEDCSSSVPPDVPSHFGTLCIFAMDQCCKDYFQKKHDCDAGVDLASSTGSCDSAADSAKNCCAECARGKEVGTTRGAGGCSAPANDDNADHLLAGEAFIQCCKRAASEAEHKEAEEKKEKHPPPAVYLSRPSVSSSVASLCEEYAPNELCAHHCIPVPGSYKCECNPGFQLMADGRNCMEVEKNRCKPKNPCQHKCNDNGVEVKCSCRRGYQLMADGKSCEDIDECKADPPLCLPFTDCYNIQGSYKCIPKKNYSPKDKGQCPPGFARNSKNNVCDDINECTLPNPPCPAYLCDNTIGGYKCGGVSGDPANLANQKPAPPPDDRCPPGFKMGYNDECEDVDECALRKDDCNPLSQYCINTRGSFYCQNKVSKHCRPGFKIDPATNKCEDINECEDGQDICRFDQVCVNVPGEYDCKPRDEYRKNQASKCPEGMRMKPGTNTCEDIDECLEGTHLCDAHQNCLNTNGSHECNCKLGYEVDPITGGCVDINECAANLHNCIDGSQRCDNTIGSFICVRFTSCGTGYTLQASTSECEDIDECAMGTHNCMHAGPDWHCENHPGSFRCVKNRKTTTSTTAQPEYEYEYYDSDRMHAGPDWHCENHPGSFRCVKNRKTTTSTTAQQEYEYEYYDSDRMHAGPDWHCENHPGSFRCVKNRKTTTSTTAQPEYEYEYYDSDRMHAGPDWHCENHPGSFRCVKNRKTTTSTTAQPEYEYEYYDSDRLHAGPDWHCENHPGSFRCVKNRKTTTSTTAQPEYEYEYYDSDEEIDNTTSTEIKPAPKPEPKTEPASTTTTTPAPTAPVLPVSIDDRIKPPETEPSNTDDRKIVELQTPEETGQPESKTPVSQPEKSSESQTPEYPPPEPQRPEYMPPASERPEYTPPEPQRPEYTPPEPQIPEYTPPKPQRPEYTEPHRPEYTSPEAQRPEYLPSGAEKQDPYHWQIPEENPPSPQRPEEIPKTPLKNTPNYYETDNAPGSEASPTPPQVVLVDVGKETASVEGKKEQDGSVVVDTKDVPKNKWTKVNEKPSNCRIGFEEDNLGNCVDIDECASNRHSCSGLTETCRNTVGGYLCDCAEGFRRDLASGDCLIITTPTPTSTQPTQPSKSYFWGYPDFRPVNTRPFRPRTLCDVGFHLNSKTGKCEDIDECHNGQANCAAVELCINTEGGYRCECPPNWKLDETRHRCVPMRSKGGMPPGYHNQPIYPPPSETELQQTFKGSKVVDPEVLNFGDSQSVISCPSGYKLGYDNACEDIDECSTGEARCFGMLCTNLPGGYVCSCPPGHRLVDGNHCEDVDECAMGGDMPICSQNADCENTIGSYQCKCHKGFRSAPVNDKVCVDVDECTESATGSLCQHRCNNVWGGYRCSCHRGYRLNPDNSTCSDVDECTEFKSKIVCVGRCLNEPGSYRCTCPAGYRLSEDKRSCIDIDECETGEAHCATAGQYSGSSDVCLNTRGGYRCHRITCPPGYKLESRHRCTRIEKICPLADWECAHQPTTYSYNFITFVSKLYIPESKVDLFTMRGPSWPNANMRFQLRLVNVDAPPSVKDKADINAFLLVHSGNQAVMSLVRSLEGPQSIELELSMELYNGEQFGGIAVARLYIYVSEYEF